MSATDLVIGGMTCASCAVRIEKKLNKLDGVTATVNFATETAHVDFPSSTGLPDLISVVERVGYTAALPAAQEHTRQQAIPARLPAVILAAAPVIIVSMVPALQFTGWQWVALALTTPVATWGAWPFHRAAMQNVRHATATMDTLVSVGVAAAYLWSLYALITGTGHSRAGRWPRSRATWAGRSATTWWRSRSRPSAC